MKNRHVRRQNAKDLIDVDISLWNFYWLALREEYSREELFMTRNTKEQYSVNKARNVYKL